MSLTGYWNDLISGQKFGTSDGIAATDAATTAQLAQLNQADLNNGLITQAQYDQMQTDLATQTDSSVQGQNAEITQGLEEGAAQGLANEEKAVSTVTSGVTGVAGGLIGSFLKSLPWWVWLGAAAALFFYLGGGGFLERRARERLSR